MTSKATLFAREATGLVRGLGLVDQFLISMSTINVTGGYVLEMILGPFFFPGANMVAVFALGAIPAVFFVITYSILGAAIPRAGGDYVWVGRIFNQRIATLMAIFVLFSGMWAAAPVQSWYFVSFALAQAFLSLGVVTGNPSLAAMGGVVAQPPVGFIISLIVVAVIMLIAFFGLDFFKKIQIYAFVFFFATMALLFVGILSVNPGGYAASFDTAMKSYNITHAQVMSATSSNPSLATSNDIWMTLLAWIPIGWMTYSGFNYGTYVAGETKNVSKNFPRSLLLSTLITLVSLCLLTVVTYNALGVGFVGGISSLYNTGKLGSLPVEPTVNLLISFVLPAWMGLLINLNIAVGFFLVGLAYTVVLTRILFAMAFDRVIPSRLADVNERFHSPHFAVLLFTISAVIFTTILWYAGYVAFYLNTSLVYCVFYMIAGMAAILFPIIKKDMYKRLVKPLPGWLSWEFAGIPMLSIGGIGVVVVWAFAFYAYVVPLTTFMYLGTSLTAAVGYVIVLAVFALVLVEASRLYNKRKFGLDILLATKEIPPE